MRSVDADYIMSAFGIFTDKEHGNEHFLYGIETAKEIVANAPTAVDWISVNDRLPDEGKYVLVWESQGFAYCDKLIYGIWNIGANNGAIITHWMPLPEPPKEVSEDG